MKVIKKLQEQIHSELEDSKHYIECAMKRKDTDEELANLYYTLSSDEMSHADKLHKMVVAIIEDYKKKEGEPPEAMLAVYNYLHEQEIALAKEIKVMWAMYKE